MKHRIKELIKEKGYTQAAFAEKLGITRSGLLQQIGDSPSSPTLERVADALGVEMWELFSTREEIIARGHSEIHCPKCGQAFDLRN